MIILFLFTYINFIQLYIYNDKFDIWHASIATAGNTRTDYVTLRVCDISSGDDDDDDDIHYRNRIRANACTHLRLREQYACINGPPQKRA